MNASEMFPSRYLKASDLGDKTPIMTISGIEMADMPDKTQKPLVEFNEHEKGLVCNKTNWNTLIKLFGSETDSWIGKKVRIGVVEVAFKGDLVESIRISPKLPTSTAPASAKAETESDDIPY